MSHKRSAVKLSEYEKATKQSCRSISLEKKKKNGGNLKEARLYKRFPEKEKKSQQSTLHAFFKKGKILNQGLHQRSAIHYATVQKKMQWPYQYFKDQL